MNNTQSDASDVAIKVEHISKTFHEQAGARSFKEAFVNIGRKLTGKKENKFHKGDFTALKDINFEVKKGEFFGIVGRNGCGKSTLLKIIAGVYTPTKGAIAINGKLTPFIELGVGFNPELSGRDNVFLNGALLGFNRKQMEEMYNDIVEFAELQEFMGTKLKNYSSGMQVRLAFSVAIRADSDILLLDEVLAVGDEAFQRKCYEYFQQIKEQDKTVIIVTHDMSAVEKYCDRAIMIENGNVAIEDNSEVVSNSYKRLFDPTIPKYGTKEYLDLKKLENHSYENKIKRIGTKKLYFEDIDINYAKEKVQINAKIIAHNDIRQPVLIAYAVKNKNGDVIFGDKFNNSLISKAKKGDSFNLIIEFPKSVYEGIYYIDLSILLEADNEYTDIWYDCLSFKSNIKGYKGFPIIINSNFKVS